MMIISTTCTTKHTIWQLTTWGWQTCWSDSAPKLSSLLLPDSDIAGKACRVDNAVLNTSLLIIILVTWAALKTIYYVWLTINVVMKMTLLGAFIGFLYCCEMLNITEKRLKTSSRYTILILFWVSIIRNSSVKLHRGNAVKTLIWTAASVKMEFAEMKDTTRSIIQFCWKTFAIQVQIQIHPQVQKILSNRRKNY